MGAKVHPAPGQTADELAIALDGIGLALRKELSEVATVFIDLSSRWAAWERVNEGPASEGKITDLTMSHARKTEQDVRSPHILVR